MINKRYIEISASMQHTITKSNIGILVNHLNMFPNLDHSYKLFISLRYVDHLNLNLLATRLAKLENSKKKLAKTFENSGQ